MKKQNRYNGYSLQDKKQAAAFQQEMRELISGIYHLLAEVSLEVRDLKKEVEIDNKISRVLKMAKDQLKQSKGDNNHEK